MINNKTNREVSQLYLELASECFGKAKASEHVDVAEALRRMGRCYVRRAVALDASLTPDLVDMD
jgi:hypothetical protein